MKTKLKTREITIIGLLSAVTMVLGATPLGFIPVGPTMATTMHIPTMIGGLLFGPRVGGWVGLIFGGFSMFRAFTNPTPVSFIFYNPIVAILPRVLIGIVPYYVNKGLKPILKGMSSTISGLVGSLVNTVGVLGLVYIFHGQKYAMALGLDPSNTGKILLGVALTNGIPEAILAALLVTGIVKVYRSQVK